MAGGIGIAQAGDTYQVKLKETHLNCGTYRNPTNREPVEGEAYIKIPRRYAVQYSIYNSPEGLGSNLFIVSSRDGFLNNERLRAQGNSGAGDNYAKQFAVDKNLRRIGEWYRNQRAQVGDIVQVTWQSSTEVLVEIVR